MNEDSLLRYADERDKAYGIAGMTITLVVGRAEDLLAEINLDAEPAETMVMTHDYGFRGNPHMSAKIVWTQALDQLRTATSMALGNIVCRRYVMARRGLSKTDTDTILDAVRCEAATHCSLDTDEADAIFERALNTVDRIFRHNVVHEAARNLADQLTERRSMSAREAVELLAAFGIH